MRHLGFEKCGRGLTSRPKETAGEAFLDELFVLFRYPPRSAPALLGGTFAIGEPTRRLPPSGGAADLVTDGGEEVGIVPVEPCVLDRFRGRAGAFCCMMVLELNGFAGLVGVVQESD